MNIGRKILSLLLTVCMLICMLPTAAFASSSGDYMKVAMPGSGRKYFNVVGLRLSFMKQRQRGIPMSCWQ